MSAPREPDPLRVWLGNLGHGISKVQIATCLNALGVDGIDTHATLFLLARKLRCALCDVRIVTALICVTQALQTWPSSTRALETTLLSCC